MLNRLTKKPDPSFQKGSAGFSLVELLVSIAIFAMVITMAVGTLMVLVDANAKAQNMQEVLINMNFAVDSITREVRTGRSFYCTSNESSLDSLDNFDNQDCPGGNTILSIVEGGTSLSGGTSGGRVAYRFNNSEATIERRIGTAAWLPITSSNVTITSARFFVTDSNSALDGDDQQANVTIYIEGFAGALLNVDSHFDLQTTITRRVLDI